MINNYHQYRDYLISCGLPEKVDPTKETPLKYYVIELIRRGKDNPDMPAANYHVKNYYIFSIERLDMYWNEIVTICNALRLRAYASVNYKDSESVMLSAAQELIRRVSCKDFRSPWSVFDSCSGKYLSRKDKKWVVDVDGVSENGIITDEIKVKKYENAIRSCAPLYNDNIIAELTTNTGLHILTKPFNRYEFDNIAEKRGLEKSKDIVHPNHLTLLYCNI